MDEWGTSVWDTPSEPVLSQRPLGRISPPIFPDALEPPPSEPTTTFAPLDDLQFGETTQPEESNDFGDDFGDFDGGQTMGFDDADVGSFREAYPISAAFPPSPLATWEPLRLDPFPPSHELSVHVQRLLANVWTPPHQKEITTSEDIRQVEGLAQILITPESRTLYDTLFNVSPTVVTRPVNWTRSRIRRQHLISLGIPINLDEVMPHANGKPLPALNITTRPSSAPPGPRPDSHPTPPPESDTRAATSRSGSPRPSGRAGSSRLGFGPKPELDDAKIAEMLALDPDNLPLLPLPTLEAHLNTLRALTSDTSSLLTYLLQTRESLQQNSETYNGLIAELVGEAQKLKVGSKTRTAAGKRGSAL